MRTVDPGGLLPALQLALTGAGPAVLPLEPSAPDAQRILSALRPEVPLETEGIAVVLPTSGSTGLPKGVLLSADALTHSALATLDRLGGPGQWLLALSPSRIAGLQVLVRSLLGGTTPVPVEPGPFTADAFATATARLAEDVRRYASLVPTQLHRLLTAPAPPVLEALRSYDAILLGGGAATASLLARAASHGVNVITTYGMTETCGGCVYDGTPLDEVTVALSPEGRISLGGPVLFSGYRLDPAATAEALVDGRHRTGDLGRITEDGRLEVLGRMDDIVVSGGVNVPLPAVEDAVSSFPGLTEAAVVGVPDPVWGTRVVAFVVCPGAVPALADLRAHVGTLYPKAYAPRRIVPVDALPYLASGKVDRERLRSVAQG